MGDARGWTRTRRGALPFPLPLSGVKAKSGPTANFLFSLLTIPANFTMSRPMPLFSNLIDHVDSAGNLNFTTLTSGCKVAEPSSPGCHDDAPVDAATPSSQAEEPGRSNEPPAEESIDELFDRFISYNEDNEDDADALAAFFASPLRGREDGGHSSCPSYDREDESPTFAVQRDEEDRHHAGAAAEEPLCWPVSTMDRIEWLIARALQHDSSRTLDEMAYRIAQSLPRSVRGHPVLSVMQALKPEAWRRRLELRNTIARVILDLDLSLLEDEEGSEEGGGPSARARKKARLE